MRLSLAHERDLIEKTAEISDERKLSVRASAISFFRPPAVEVTLILEHDESWPFTVASGSDAGFFASFSLSSDTRRAWSGRLASLDFSALANLAIPDENDLLKGYLRVGGAGSDICLGGDGDDTLNGQAGTDTLAGNEGNDVLSDTTAVINEAFKLPASLLAALA